jgi:hypothetical protein
VHFQPVPIGLEPAPHLGILVIRGVVLNQDRSPAAIDRGEVMEEGQIRGSFEDAILLVMEAGMPEFDGAQDFDTLPFAADGDLGRMADAAPGGVERRVLTEAGFIGENQRPVLGLGLFLRLG